MKNTIQLVSDFYDRFPYPPDPLTDEPPPGFNWRWSLENVYSACSGATFRIEDSFEPIRILDAGCGTGVSTDYLAHLNPGSEILAVDISLGAIQVAMERVRRSGGVNKAQLRFENRSFLDLETQETFDYINSVGVLHHLSDPSAGLRALEGLLKPGGIIHLYLYAAGGRWEINRAQRAFKTIGIRVEDNELKLARQLLLDLPKNNQIRRNYEEQWAIECESDVNFADMYFHPKETIYNLEQLTIFIASTNLEFAGFSNPIIWNLERLLKGELLARAKELSQKEQWKLIEDLDPRISHFEFFLTKNPFQKYYWENDDELLSTSGKVNPCLAGWPGKILHDSDMNRIEVNDNGLKLLEALEKNPGTPIGLLPMGWDESRIASTARDLQKQHLLLLYPLDISAA